MFGELKLWNIVLTGVLLFAAYGGWSALAYDGYCYGFTDGKWPCSFAQHFEANHAWFPLLLIFFFPQILVAGGLVYLANDAVYRAVVHRRMQSWLEETSEGTTCGGRKGRAGRAATRARSR